MSARMKSSSADPDNVSMSRCKVATDAWLRPINSATMAGSVSIGTRGNRQRVGSRPALAEVEAIRAEQHSDALRTAKFGLDPPALLPEPHALRIGQRGLLGGGRRGDDLAVAHLVDVGVHQAGN